MKKTVLTIFIFLSVFILSCGNESEMDTTILTQNTFELSNPAFEYTLVFKEDKSYQVTYQGPLEAGLGVAIVEGETNGIFYVEGEYELNGTTILLHPKKFFDKPNGETIAPEKAWGEAECTIVDKELNTDFLGNSTIYTKYLAVKISNAPADMQNVDLGISGFLKQQ